MAANTVHICFFTSVGTHVPQHASVTPERGCKNSLSTKKTVNAAVKTSQY